MNFLDIARTRCNFPEFRRCADPQTTCTGDPKNVERHRCRSCANLLRDYIDEIILEILGGARDTEPRKPPQRVAVLHLDELRARILAIASRVGVDDVPENERIQQRKKSD